MKITREWCIPNSETFLMPPIQNLLSKYVGDGKKWADPFSNKNSIAEFTNDINPSMPTKFHLDAHDFAKVIPTVNGILFDPPYSLEQMKRSYENIGKRFTMRDGQILGRWTELKNTLTRKIAPGGIVISFGWNTNGFGIKNGFEIIEILILAHGGGHNDTFFHKLLSHKRTNGEWFNLVADDFEHIKTVCKNMGLEISFYG